MRGGIAHGANENRSSTAKKVSWENLHNLCQVRLFAAEEAPSFSGAALQEQYQAKETKFLHHAKPVSENDLPPGFTNFAVKDNIGGRNVSLGMDAQVQWHCPERFLNNAAWQVVVVNETAVVSEEQKREHVVPESIYENVDLIPWSPMEPLETSLGTKELPEIPLCCDEDEEDIEQVIKGRDGIRIHGKISEKNEPDGRVADLPIESPASLPTLSARQPDQGLNNLFMTDVDPSVVAAFARAYAVLKARERGSLVDHDLLLKTLGNPTLIRALLPLNKDLALQLRDLSRQVNESLLKSSCYNEVGRKSANAAFMGSGMFNLPGAPGSRSSLSVESSSEPLNFVSWSTRPFLGAKAEDKAYAHGESQSSNLGVSGISTSQQSVNRQDIMKDLIHQHGMERSRSEVYSRGPTEMEHVVGTKPLPIAERHRNPVLGSSTQIGQGGQQSGTSGYGRGEGFSSARFGAEASQARFQKPCIYFNTPKGCRRGASCFYQHTVSSDQPYGERARTEFFPFQSTKRPKSSVQDRD
ncbi:hypothetical protein KP509_35G024100 [Ceratopteris richardii]|uniref:C3H1-type domain-containing protein n=1 Tax=Ceratopteris richardii TaxID=49495 RepID=A0A8T2QDU9_CERRI|nr:hypothetical protein KP509_35G024100 [Ceratopteris richardii]